jgi:FkbM family methyltransferase
MAGPGVDAWQQRLIGLYGALSERGVLQRPGAQQLFEVGYGAYKLLFEAPTVGRLRPFVRPGGLAIDVGANVGFFTRRFARWSQPGGAVLALEPEALNAHRLRARLRGRRLDGIVECLEAVATDHDGIERLAVNRRHPGDHRIGVAGDDEDDAVEVPAWTIDALVAARTARRVSLIKVDVQGAELRVLRGAARTIAEHRPALFIEVHEPGLATFGTSAAELVDHVAALGYEGHRLSRRGMGPAEAPADLVAAFARRYGDVLFLPVEI